jgi:hypothetical protein
MYGDSDVLAALSSATMMFPRKASAETARPIELAALISSLRRLTLDREIRRIGLSFESKIDLPA